MATTSAANEYELLRTDIKDPNRPGDNDGVGNGFGRISPARSENDDGNRSGSHKSDRPTDRIYTKDVHLNINSTSANIPEAQFKRPNVYTQKRIFALGALFACLCLLTIGAAILHFYGIRPCGCKYRFVQPTHLYNFKHTTSLSSCTHTHTHSQSTCIRHIS